MWRRGFSEELPLGVRTRGEVWVRSWVKESKEVVRVGEELG